VNDYLLSLILGIVEGLTEFLPVSSTAHLRIVEAAAGVDLNDGFWKMYSVVIQLGAVLCLPVYFGKRIAKFIRTFPRGELGDKTILTHPVSLTLIAFCCTAIPAFMLKKVIGKNLESLFVMGMALVAGGAIMWAVDYVFGSGESGAKPTESPEHPNTPLIEVAHAEHEVAPLDYQSKEIQIPGKINRVEDMSLLQAIWIGLIQTLAAIFPGTSRSMATIAAGQVTGMTRASALEFSFFLSLPTMFVATLYDFYKTILHPKPEVGELIKPVTMDTHKWIILAIGFVVSFAVALAVVHWFMAWVRKHGFTPFAIYRILAGAAVLTWVLAKGA